MKNTVIVGLLLTCFTAASGFADATYSKWDAGLEGGYDLPQTVTSFYAKKQGFIWASAGYHPLSWLSVGMEGGHLFAIAHQ